jgi:hypothetical protein
MHDLFQAHPLAAEFLGALRLFPDIRRLQLAAYLDQPVLLLRVVKDTP